MSECKTVCYWWFSLIVLSQNETVGHFLKSRLSTFLLEQRAHPSSSDSDSNTTFYAHFYVELALFKHDFLSHFQVKWHCSWAHVKAENMTMSKLSLLVRIRASSLEISGFKHERAFFLRQPVLVQQNNLVDSERKDMEYSTMLKEDIIKNNFLQEHFLQNFQNARIKNKQRKDKKQVSTADKSNTSKLIYEENLKPCHRLDFINNRSCW